jgi:hypothetical protein
MFAHFTLSPKSTASTPSDVFASLSLPFTLALPTAPTNMRDSAIRKIFFIYIIVPTQIVCKFKANFRKFQEMKNIFLAKSGTFLTKHKSKIAMLQESVSICQNRVEQFH